MTTIIYKGRAGRGRTQTLGSAPARPHVFISDVPRQQEQRPAKRKPTKVHDGKRIKEIKNVLDSKSREQRIARLVQMIESQGPEKFQHEIDVHERKAGDLREALQAFSDKQLKEALK